MRALVTGGAGFVGVHLVHRMLNDPQVVITVLDSGRPTAVPQHLPDSPRLRVERGDVLDADTVTDLVAGSDVVVHLAAETFVDASIADDRAFIATNVLGTATILRALLTAPGGRLLHVSTDEVFGETDGAPFTEASVYRPRNPYAATKAAADHLVRAYVATHRIDAVTCHFSNLYGPWQYPEKLIPVTVARLLAGRPALIYGSGRQSRTWLHVRDAATGALRVLRHGRTGESYLIGSEQQRRNLDVVHRIADLLRIPRGAAVVHVADRPGHDHSYAVDIGRANRELDWAPRIEFDAGLIETVDWMTRHDGWWLR